MKKQFKSYATCVILILIGLLFGIHTNAYAKESILYGGGPLYNNAGTHQDMIRGSGFTTIVLWTIHVHGDGDLVFNDRKIVDDGVYVGRSEWPGEVAAFKEGQTSVRRVEIAIGSWGVPDFETIESLINAEGTGPDSTLYKNFLALKEAVPAIDAISYDDESNYDVDSSVALTLMLNDLGYKISLCPYTYSYYWSSLYSTVQNQRPGIIDRIDLQCYAGGGYNNPGTWNEYFGGLRVAPGLWCYPNGQTPSQVQTQMSSWNDSYNIAGGFMWLLDDMLSSSYQVADYASAINNALDIDPAANSLVTLYQHCDYGGWTADFDLGYYTAEDIVTAGGQDVDTSSLKMLPGYKTTFYDGDNFTGSTLIKTADSACLVDDGWNDRISSMIVEVDPVLLGYWRFNDNSGALVSDDSGYGHDGQLVDMDSAAWTSGKQCGGLSFDGLDNLVEISGFKGVVGHASRTCTAWIKTSQASGEILAWGNQTYGRKWIIRVNEGGQLRAEVQGGYIVGTTLINDNNWHHIAVVLNNDGSPDISEAQLYVDGQRDTIGWCLDKPINTAADQDMTIGGFALTGNRYFQSLIDEVRIYNYPLSATEIQNLYQQHALVADSEPDGDVDFNDFAVLAGAWQDSDCQVDLTCDCTVDMDDLKILIDEWLMQS